MGDRLVSPVRERERTASDRWQTQRRRQWSEGGQLWQLIWMVRVFSGKNMGKFFSHLFWKTKRGKEIHSVTVMRSGATQCKRLTECSYRKWPRVSIVSNVSVSWLTDRYYMGKELFFSFGYTIEPKAQKKKTTNSRQDREWSRPWRSGISATSKE